MTIPDLEGREPVMRVGRYTLYRAIASGGMATVYVGRITGAAGFSRVVAVKRLHPQYAREPDFVAMLIDEARLVSRIRHPNVVQTLDIVTSEGELFLVMDYVEGESLSRLRRSLPERGGGIPPEIVGSIVVGALQGLHAAHEARDERGRPLEIVHRDVSPQNILVGVDGAARVLDFGIAKAQNRLSTSHEGHVKGKLAYMPPEQLRGEGVSRRTDIYAAGVVLWELLTGLRLFAAESEGETVMKILASTIVPPSRHAPGTAPFDAIVMRALAADPGARYPTARAMAEDLETAVRVASTAQVADWVQRTAGETLSERAGVLAEMESGEIAAAVPTRSIFPGGRGIGAQEKTSPTVPALETGSRPVAVHGRSTVAFAIGGAAALVLGLVGVLLIVIASSRAKEAQSRPARSAAVAIESRAPPPPALPSERATPVPPAAAPSTPAAPLASSSSATAVSARPVVVLTATAPARPRAAAESAKPTAPAAPSRRVDPFDTR